MKILSMRGKQIDMAALIAKNPNTPAIGNASMNARGDIIKGGKVVKPREQIAMEYHENNPKAVKSMGLSALAGEMFDSPAAAVAASREAAKQARELAKAGMTAQPAQTPEQAAQAVKAAGMMTTPAPTPKKRKLVEDDAADL